ncbi:MAG: M28 family peptidase [Cryobacterium sp.]|nr:M28 family peptidase [Oligoflexia bacterium]
MEKTSLRSLVAVSVLSLFGTVALASGEDHHRLHWNEDQAAYRSFRIFKRLELQSRTRRFKNNFQSFAPVEKINRSDLVSSLETLSGKYDPVLTNRGSAKGRAAARAYLKSEFEAAGYTTHEESYRTGVNFVAERTGASGKFLIVSAHYDSMNNPGADDDGSGTVGLLSIARTIGKRPLKHGLRFVAFDQEEDGLVGSGAYVKALVARGGKSEVLADIELEMLGYNGRNDGSFHVISCDRPDSQFLVDSVITAVSNLRNGLQLTSACTDRSDHARFWDQDIPAIVISQNFFGGDSNPCYHRACDTVEKMHLGYFGNLAETAVNAVASIISANE